MSVTIDVTYEGDLHCVAVHGPSGERILTDAPVDNQGRGEHFSPTDLVGTALGTCMLTVMGIAARAHGIAMEGATARVTKEMSNVPRRHISRLAVVITVPGRHDARARALLERAAHGCPVHASLGPETKVEIEFVYPDAVR
jgi:putative redox protein